MSVAFDGAKMGKRIMRQRKRQRLTQEQVAGQLGMKRETYNTIENGKRALKDHEIIELADILGASTDYLLRGIEPENLNICATTGLSNEAINTLRSWKESSPVTESIDEEGQKTITIGVDDSECLEVLEALITHPAGISFLHALRLFLLADSGETYTPIDNEQKRVFTFIKARDANFYLYISKNMIESGLFDMLKEPLKELREASQGGKEE